MSNSRKWNTPYSKRPRKSQPSAKGPFSPRGPSSYALEYNRRKRRKQEQAARYSESIRNPTFTVYQPRQAERAPTPVAPSGGEYWAYKPGETYSEQQARIAYNTRRQADINERLQEESRIREQMRNEEEMYRRGQETRLSSLRGQTTSNYDYYMNVIAPQLYYAGASEEEIIRGAFSTRQRAEVSQRRRARELLERRQREEAAEREREQRRQYAMLQEQRQYDERREAERREAERRELEMQSAASRGFAQMPPYMGYQTPYAYQTWGGG